MKLIPTLYLFESGRSVIFAVADDKTGCKVPKLSGDTSWLLRREMKPGELPADVVLTAYNKGFCVMHSDDYPDLG
jgi:hypothetical protein